MTDNVMRLVFGQGKLDPRYQKFLEKFQIMIICVREDRRSKWENSHFYHRCQEDGINVGFLERPCVAQPVFNSKRGTYEFKEAELWHLVTSSFWNKCNGPDRDSGLAIAVSHYRALWQSEGNSPGEGWTLTLEEDVEEAQGCYHNMLQLVKMLCDLDSMKDVLYISLSWNIHHLTHFKRIANQHFSRDIPGTSRWGLFLKEMARDGSRSLQVGQGHRAIMIGPDFRWHLACGKISNWFDLWVQDQLDLWISSNHSSTIYAALTVPPLFTHPIDTTDRFRGSARLHRSKASPGEELSDYIVVLFDRGWGFCSRIHTLVTAILFCSMHHFGLYIHWQANAACPGELSDVVPLLDNVAKWPP